MTIPVETSMTTLAEHEAVIERGLTTFIEVGNALLAIRDGRLYREQFATFENYCQMRWGWSRQRAQQYIEGAEVTGRLSTMVDTPAPTAERQVRPLTKLPAEEQPVAWRKAVEDAGGKVPTQAQVERVVRQRIVDEEEPAYGDGFLDEGVPVREVWEEADEAFAAELERSPDASPLPVAARAETSEEREARAREERIARESQRFARAISYTAQIISNDLGRRRLAEEYDQDAALNPFIVTREAIATAAENLRLLAEVWDR